MLHSLAWKLRLRLLQLVEVEDPLPYWRCLTSPARLRGGVMKTLLSAGMLVAAGHGLEERRQWALSSVSGPPCFRLFSKNHKFFKNHKKKYY